VPDYISLYASQDVVRLYELRGSERLLVNCPIRLLLLQVEHAFLGIYVHAEIAQEVETQQASHP
jgi:hypothetical protein